MNKQLDEVEGLCICAIREGNPRAAEIHFLSYLSYRPETQSTGFIKAYMLLYYLSLDEKKLFYTTFETVTQKELSEEESIGIVMRVEGYVNIGATEKLRKLIEEDVKAEFLPLLKDILELQMKRARLDESETNTETARSEENDMKNIEDAVFIGRNAVSF